MKGQLIFSCPFNSIVSYIISCYLNSIPHAIKPNVKLNKFELIPVTKDSEISQAFCSPNKTGAVNILKWIEENDAELASKELSVQPEAKFFR